MEQPIFVQLDFTYQRPEAGLKALNFRDIPTPPEAITDGQIVHFAPKAIGGNHKHPRTEWFVGFGELELAWIDENNQVQRRSMSPENRLYLIKMPSWVPHAVLNTSETQPAILIEFADALQSNVEKVAII